jgi:hypothetical protein
MLLRALTLLANTRFEADIARAEPAELILIPRHEK